MSENSIRGSRDQASRVLKSNAYTGRRSGTPDSPNSGQGAASPVPNAGPGSPTSTTSSVTNHHPVSHVQHHPNHRPYTQRGRHRGDGGYFGGHNHLGGHHSGSYRRPSPPIPGPPFSKALVDFMIKQWNDFEVNYKKSRGEPVDNGLMPPPAAPTSPRVPTSHMNSPHRGQHTRYPYHQNSTGNSWSVNSGGGRRFSDNGDHSNTGSLRRHHARDNSSWQRSSILGNRQNSPNNTLNRPAGPRHLQHPHRPVASPTPPPVAEATSKKAGNAGGSPVVEAAAAQLETLTIKSSEAQQQEVASTSSETAAAASAARKKNTGYNGPFGAAASTIPVPFLHLSPGVSHPAADSLANRLGPTVLIAMGLQLHSCRCRQLELTTGLPSAYNVGRESLLFWRDFPTTVNCCLPPSYLVTKALAKGNFVVCLKPPSTTFASEGGANGEVRTAEDEKCAVSSTSPNDEASRTSPRVKHQQQHQTPSHHQHQRYIHPPRRRAATTQSSGSGLQVGTAAFSLPASVAGGSAPRALETASVASSSFCSLIDQVDAMSSADQYFTPEPPSSPSSPSVSLSVGVEGAAPSNTAHFFQAPYASGDNSEAAATAASPTSAQAGAASIATDR
ncbi:unnamed protein product [Mesocestoides corti]|uniref:Uncharacterized protein n=1 Tax=Mesocestoides corti TaxID=53468 RepID=A0A0R3UNK1_MESCO|nr:unnamed protein product [Mesocestoides corti]